MLVFFMGWDGLVADLKLGEGSVSEWVHDVWVSNMLSGLQSASATLRYDMVLLFEILFIWEFNCVKCGSASDFFYFFLFIYLWSKL